MGAEGGESDRDTLEPSPSLVIISRIRLRLHSSCGRHFQIAVALTLQSLASMQMSMRKLWVSDMTSQTGEAMVVEEPEPHNRRAQNDVRGCTCSDSIHIASI
jgi:hypothetical protein